MSGSSISVPLQVVGVPTWIVIASAMVLLLLLTGTFLLTVGYSLIRYRRRARHEKTRERLQGEMLDRLYTPEDLAWNDWVKTLSGHERTVVESLLDEYLRELQGSDAERLRGLGHALNIPDRSRRRLQRGGHYDRLHALTWLALLREPPEIELLKAHCTETTRERAAAVRALYESDHTDISSIGIDFLLSGATGGMSVFGIDTLYRVAETNPTPLFDRAATDASSWDPALEAQVLLVARHVPTVVGGGDLSWVKRSLSSPAERIRREAARALGGYGWRHSLREELDVKALGADDSPRVRASVYQMLGEWGDDAAIQMLVSLAAEESDERARVAAAEALVPHQKYHSFDIPESLTDAWSWAEANAAFDELATDVSTPHNY